MQGCWCLGLRYVFLEVIRDVVTALLQDSNMLMNTTARLQLICVPGQLLLCIVCLPSWCGRYLQGYCSVARFFRAADILVHLCTVLEGYLSPGKLI